ncbi:GNAT family N-acetyltransferase [Longitalea arenae]|uniref:GNAT family N-acetyltransferase n=1 Tax=Longitalea arenae TaxID=2812558 RepID=UPI0019689784|nr:GNAT family N-acetyltransferase [Longitalea arenae]
MTTTSIKSANKSDQEQAIAVITLAFATDPLSRFIYPDPHRYLSYFPEVVGLFAGNAFKQGTAYYVNAFSGVALWLPPNVHPREEEMEALLKQTVPEQIQENVFAVLKQMGDYHPAEPHWYLPMIGVDPSHQGKGHGSALMQHALTRCDQENKLAYLETATPRNIPLYKRYGFELLATIQIGSAPPVYPMVRQPREL